MSSDLITLLNLFGAQLPGRYAFALDHDGQIGVDHPLAGEIEAAMHGQAASLPYPMSQSVSWVTIAPSADALRRVIEDLRSWILPSFGWEAVPSIVSDAAGASTLGTLLLQHAPNGYFRWYTRSGDTNDVIDRLAVMRRVLGQAPARQTHLRPTLEMLRREFTLGLATGDRTVAQEAIDEIDQRQLDTASNSLSMRIRLAAAFGDYQAIVDHPQLDDLLSMRLPRRVIESVLLAHHSVFLAEAEETGDLALARDAYLPFYDRLAGLAGPISSSSEPTVVRMAAYEAAIEEDAERLKQLASVFVEDSFIAGLIADLPEAPALDESMEIESREASTTIVSYAIAVSSGDDDPFELVSIEAKAGDFDTGLTAPDTRMEWASIPALIADRAHAQLGALLDYASRTPDALDPGDGDFVLELFVDSDIASDSKKQSDADRVLTTVIDAYICEDRFPRRERMPLYQTVIDIWSSNRSQSADPIDGQLLLTMADAMLRLDGKLETAVAATIIRWWEARPVRSRLSWLSESLELLTEHSISQDYLALWYDGAALIKIDHESLSATDRALWRRLGLRLGLNIETVVEALGGTWTDAAEREDPLRACGFTKIAIVSLHERAARDAASQIAKRTDANVVVVTDHAAGEGTASAVTADVILFVWGATKHAVYRAFDKVRDRLEYVQGTGSASIVRALERRLNNSEA